MKYKNSSMFNIKQKSGKKYMTWEQTQERYPKTNPFGDNDRDGFRNNVDCRPFDRNQQGLFDTIKKLVATVSHKKNPSNESERIAVKGAREYERQILKIADYASQLKDKERQDKIKHAGKYREVAQGKARVAKFKKMAPEVYNRAKSIYEEGKGKREKSAKATMRLYQQFAPLSPGLKQGYYYDNKREKPGRPRGIYKNYIPGVGPVHIYDYRKWERQQRAVQRMQAQSPEQYQQVQQQQVQQYPQQQRQYPQQYSQQQPAQRSDNILHAPNFMKGELRNIGQNTATPIVDNANVPNSNRYGDEYTNIDPMSGRPILQRRVRERWSEP